MPFTQADKDQALADWQAVEDAANAGLAHAQALVVDTVDVAALQQQIQDLTTANATLTQQVESLTTANAALTQSLADANAAKDALQAKLDAVKADRATEESAEAAADAARAKIDADVA